MPSPSDPTQGVTPAEESFLELLAETLENLDRLPRGQFLQRFFQTIAQLDLSENASSDYWEPILERRRQLADTLGKPISLKAAMVDVLASSTYLRVPILMEYEDLKKLQINAATDPLTGLYNRRLFEEHFEKELNRALRYNQHLALIFLDLHQFKEVNDRYGHPQDVLIRRADQRLYEMKHLERGGKVQPQTQQQAEKQAPRQAPPAATKTPSQAVGIPAASPGPSPRPAIAPERSEKRKWERVSLAGTRAYAQLTDDPQKTARVIDLGYGGLALEMEASAEIGSRFSAVLHVPILPPVRVLLKKLYQVRASSGQLR